MFVISANAGLQHGIGGVSIFRLSACFAIAHQIRKTCAINTPPSFAHYDVGMACNDQYYYTMAVLQQIYIYRMKYRRLHHPNNSTSCQFDQQRSQFKPHRNVLPAIKLPLKRSDPRWTRKSNAPGHADWNNLSRVRYQWRVSHLSLVWSWKESNRWIFIQDTVQWQMHFKNHSVFVEDRWMEFAPDCNSPHALTSAPPFKYIVFNNGSHITCHRRTSICHLSCHVKLQFRSKSKL